jgi:hypothetical protein
MFMCPHAASNSIRYSDDGRAKVKLYNGLKDVLLESWHVTEKALSYVHRSQMFKI